MKFLTISVSAVQAHPEARKSRRDSGLLLLQEFDSQIITHSYKHYGTTIFVVPYKLQSSPD